MTAHTHGPWTINTQADYPNPRIDGPNGRAVGHTIQRDPHPVTGQGITPAEALANARLMAAGPELLGAGGSWRCSSSSPPPHASANILEADRARK